MASLGQISQQYLGSNPLLWLRVQSKPSPLKLKQQQASYIEQQKGSHPYWSNRKMQFNRHKYLNKSYVKISRFFWRRMTLHRRRLFIFTRATLAGAGISCRRMSVRLSITSRCSTETTGRKITQTTPHDSPKSPIFCCRKSRQNSNGVTPSRGAGAGGYRLNAGAVAAN